MTHHFALLAIVFGIGFVLIFERLHQTRLDNRFCAGSLIGDQDAARIMRILAACDDR